MKPRIRRVPHVDRTWGGEAGGTLALGLLPWRVSWRPDLGPFRGVPYTTYMDWWPRRKADPYYMNHRGSKSTLTL